MVGFDKNVNPLTVQIDSHHQGLNQSSSQPCAHSCFHNRMLSSPRDLFYLLTVLTNFLSFSMLSWCNFQRDNSIILLYISRHFSFTRKFACLEILFIFQKSLLFTLFISAWIGTNLFSNFLKNVCNCLSDNLFRSSILALHSLVVTISYSCSLCLKINHIKWLECSR